jgi:hypothetical protein
VRETFLESAKIKKKCRVFWVEKRHRNIICIDVLPFPLNSL